MQNYPWKVNLLVGAMLIVATLPMFATAANTPIEGTTRESYPEDYESFSTTGVNPSSPWGTYTTSGTGTYLVASGGACTGTRCMAVADTAGATFSVDFNNDGAGVNLCTTGQSVTFSFALSAGITLNQVWHARIGTAGPSVLAQPPNTIDIALTGSLAATEAATIVLNSNTGTQTPISIGTYTAPGVAGVTLDTMHCVGSTPSIHYSVLGGGLSATGTFTASSLVTGDFDSLQVASSSTALPSNTVDLDNINWQGAPLPAPTVTGISPAQGSSAGGTAVTITGTGFKSTGANSPAVVIGGVAATSEVLVDGSTITAVTGARAAGVVSVVVTNPDGQQATLASAYTYNPLPSPVISSLTPNHAKVQGGDTIVVAGSNFRTGFTATFAGLPAVNPVFVSATEVHVDTPPHAQGVVAFQFCNTDTQCGARTFTYADETDDDNDGVFAFDDNCPNVFNPSQTDTYGTNTTGNACELWGGASVATTLGIETFEGETTGTTVTDEGWYNQQSSPAGSTVSIVRAASGTKSLHMVGAGGLAWTTNFDGCDGNTVLEYDLAVITDGTVRSNFIWSEVPPDAGNKGGMFEPNQFDAGTYRPAFSVPGGYGLSDDGVPVIVAGAPFRHFQISLGDCSSAQVLMDVDGAAFVTHFLAGAGGFTPPVLPGIYFQTTAGFDGYIDNVEISTTALGTGLPYASVAIAGIVHSDVDPDGKTLIVRSQVGDIAPKSYVSTYNAQNLGLVGGPEGTNCDSLNENIGTGASVISSEDPDGGAVAYWACNPNNDDDITAIRVKSPLLETLNTNSVCDDGDFCPRIINDEDIAGADDDRILLGDLQTFPYDYSRARRVNNQHNDALIGFAYTTQQGHIGVIAYNAVNDEDDKSDNAQVLFAPGQLVDEICTAHSYANGRDYLYAADPTVNALGFNAVVSVPTPTRFGFGDKQPTATMTPVFTARTETAAASHVGCAGSLVATVSPSGIWLWDVTNATYRIPMNVSALGGPIALSNFASHNPDTGRALYINNGELQAWNIRTRELTLRAVLPESNIIAIHTDQVGNRIWLQSPTAVYTLDISESNNATYVPNLFADTDLDKIPNFRDDDIDGDGIKNGSDPDIDGDGLCNGGLPSQPPGTPGAEAGCVAGDTDSDADDVPDEFDSSPGGTPGTSTKAAVPLGGANDPVTVLNGLCLLCGHFFMDLNTLSAIIWGFLLVVLTVVITGIKGGTSGVTGAMLGVSEVVAYTLFAFPLGAIFLSALVAGAVILMKSRQSVA